MSPLWALFTFLNAWCITLFMVIPFWIKPAKERTDKEYAAAPMPLPWKKILLVNTAASIAVTGLLALIIGSRL